MRKSLYVLFALVLGAALSLATASAQDKKKAEKRDARVSGTVQMVSKDTSTITVRDRRTNITRQVIYSAATKVTDREGKPAKIEDVKDGRRIIAEGKWNDKSQLLADVLSIRE